MRRDMPTNVARIPRVFRKTAPGGSTWCVPNLQDGIEQRRVLRFSEYYHGRYANADGPQEGLAFCLEALDNAQFGQPQVPPAPATASDQNATELLEHYWAYLLDGKASSDRNHLSATLTSTTKLTAYPDLRGPNPRP